MEDPDLERFCEELKRMKEKGKKEFPLVEMLKLAEPYGPRFQKAMKALAEGSVKHYIFKPSGRELWVFVGKEKDYRVIPDSYYCSCKDFYFKVVGGKSRIRACYHLIAVKVARIIGAYDEIVEEDEVYDLVLAESE